MQIRIPWSLAAICLIKKTEVMQQSRNIAQSVCWFLVKADRQTWLNVYWSLLKIYNQNSPFLEIT